MPESSLALLSPVSLPAAPLPAADAAGHDGHLAIVVELAGLVPWEVDLARRTLADSPALRALVGRTAGEPMDLAAWRGHVHPDDLPLLEVAHERAQRDGEALSVTHRVVRRDGTVRWVASFGRAVADAQGRATRLVGALRDVTDERRSAMERERALEAERTARARTERLQLLSQHLADATTEGEVAAAVVSVGIAATGARGAIVARLSPDDAHTLELLDWAGLPDELLEARPPIPLTAGSPLCAAVRTGAPVCASDVGAIATEFPHLHPVAERTGYHSWMAVPLAIDGRAVGAIALGFATAQELEAEDLELLLAVGRQSAQALERARLLGSERRLREVAETTRSEAERANAAKSAFLAVMSHEIRTPLNAIAGYAELLELGLRGPLTPEQSTDLARIRRAQRSLLTLIDDLLTFARIDAGRVQYAMGPVPAGDAMSTAEAVALPLAREKGITLCVERAPRGVSARADAARVQQILVNLLGNAVKFTPAGGTVRLTCASDARTVRFVVSDTGAGIEPAQHELVFEPFVQVESRPGRAAPGTGLGLAISRGLARDMGGELTVESRLGEGSVFTLELGRYGKG